LPKRFLVARPVQLLARCSLCLIPLTNSARSSRQSRGHPYLLTRAQLWASSLEPPPPLTWDLCTVHGSSRSCSCVSPFRRLSHCSARRPEDRLPHTSRVTATVHRQTHLEAPPKRCGQRRELYAARSRSARVRTKSCLRGTLVVGQQTYAHNLPLFRKTSVLAGFHP
jgi:hypothetical protein